MNELYEMIEKKIKESGYPRPISGSDFMPSHPPAAWHAGV